MVQVSVILVNFNEREHLTRVLGLLEKEFSKLSHEIIVVDNASSDGSAAIVQQQWPNVALLEPGSNLMYGKGNNLGLKRATGDWLLIMNVDVDWSPGQLKKFIELVSQKQNVGVAGPQLRYSDGRIQISAHHTFPSTWSVFVDYCLPLQQLLMKLGRHPFQESAKAHTTTHSVAHVTGTCLLLPRATYEKLGGFDPRFTMYLEETEWQKRMADAGLERWLIADTAITHFGSAAKTFAQASPHFLWGLSLYSQLHWSGPAKKIRLLKSIWLATLISDIFLLILWLPSLFLGRAGRRLRHYGKQYFRLTLNLFHFPHQAPA